ncbi:helix-turn-helix domain-containing protein [Companilactobacillus mishanensis]|nr:helix-turn-helix transcriptional regulator [Companilactobacillus mishanensis]
MRTNEEIVNILIKARKDKGISISELARLTDVAKSSISRYENRTRQFPIDQVDNFSKALGLDPEYILGFDDKDKPKELDLSEEMNDDYTLMSWRGKKIPAEELEMIRRILDGGKN